MYHEDIYTKFMIEYDKANVLSSYPSLTEYEVATFLDKAYNALIAQKVTGNNVRAMGLETDVKVVEDLSPLIVTTSLTLNNVPQSQDNALYSKNIMYVNVPKNSYLYFISAALKKSVSGTPMDEHVVRALPIKLVSHQMANKFLNKAYNLPWIKQPVGYIEQNKLYIIYDPSDSSFDNVDPQQDRLSITYIKKPNTFVKNLDDTSKFPTTSGVYTMFHSPNDNDYYKFECNDSMVEELISLAIVYALENIESARLSTKLNMRGLES